MDAQVYRPDLLAKTMRIRGASATKKVYAAALIENIGLGRANGPFKIAMYIDLHRGGVLTSFVQVFTVPADVSLSGRPVFTYMAFGTLPTAEAFQTRYLSDEMEVPLYYYDEDGSYYDAGFLVDSDHEVSEANEYNNSFVWNGKIRFTSPALAKQSTPTVFERPELLG
jgi:hypothetical protein